jgi:hypothetical protein
MNRTTTVVAALIAAAGLSTMVYAVPEQRALAWGGGPGFGGCGPAVIIILLLSIRQEYLRIIKQFTRYYIQT